MGSLHFRAFLRLSLVAFVASCGSQPEHGRSIESASGDTPGTAPGSAAAPETTAPSASTPNGGEPRTNEAVMPMGLAPPQALASGRDAGAEPPRDAGSSPPPERCDVGIYDPAAPPQALELSGSLGAHDPVIFAANGGYYFFSTGAGISVKTSPDLLNWTQQPSVFTDTPAWFQQLVPAYAPRSIWAPDISYFGGQYHLYYSVSSFGDNRSCIGHATRTDLDTGSWTDHEQVFCSNQPGQNDNFNAIDPNVVMDLDGTPWMAFGSFWNGIKMIRLDQSGARAGTELVSLASRGGGAIEGSFLVRRCGYYYLFVSFDACCRGVDSTYNQRVGRSTALRGPYVDRAGTPMLNGGGTLLLQAGGDWVGPGHNAVLFDGPRAYNVYHAYAATNGQSRLRISELAWDADGWPISGGP